MLQVPLKISEKSVTMQKLVDRSMLDNEDFRVCHQCSPKQEIRMVRKIHVDEPPKVLIF